MYIEQFHVPKIAHSSYLLGGKVNCAIVDPRRDVHIYIEEAKRILFRVIFCFFSYYDYNDCLFH